MELLILFLFLSYGLAFGAANKIPWLYPSSYLEEGDTSAWRTRLLTCPYCLGFHTGYISALFMWGFFGFPPFDWHTIVFGLLIAAFSSSAWCYIIDTYCRRLEAYSSEDSE